MRAVYFDSVQDDAKRALASLAVMSSVDISLSVEGIGDFR